MDVNKKNRMREKIKVVLTAFQISLIKQSLEDSGLVYQALNYADIHYNTLFKSALAGKPIKKEQRDRLVEFCKSVKQEKAA